MIIGKDSSGLSDNECRSSVLLLLISFNGFTFWQTNHSNGPVRVTARLKIGTLEGISMCDAVTIHLANWILNLGMHT